MEILKSHVEDESKTVLKMDKTSVMDIMKHIPTQAMAKKPQSKEEITKEMDSLSKLESELELQN